MELIERNHCVISGNEDLELLYSFKDFPVFMGCVDHSPEKDLKTDMNWWISKSTGSLQLNPLLPLDVLYQEQHAGSVGELWEEHHKEFSKFIAGYQCRNVLEIGGAHGLLAKEYMSSVDGVNWTMLEPNPSLQEDIDINVIKGFFDDKFQFDGDIDVVVHSHVFEHVYEPREFIANIGGFLDEGGLHIFSVPRMQVMLEMGYTNCINFEHTVFLTEMFVDYLLAKNGFSIIEKKYYHDNHSIFYATKKTGNKYLRYPPMAYDANRRIYEQFISNHLAVVDEINKHIDGHDGTVYLFGGHVFSQYLIGFGLDANKIECILDNDTNKQGKRLYGTSLMVQSPKILKDVENGAVILRAGVYNEEIKEDIVNNINPKVIFWE